MAKKQKEEPFAEDQKRGGEQTKMTAEQEKVSMERLERDKAFLEGEAEKLHEIEVTLTGYTARWVSQNDAKATAMRQKVTKVIVKLQGAQNGLRDAAVSVATIEPTQLKLF